MKYKLFPAPLLAAPSPPAIAKLKSLHGVLRILQMILQMIL